MAGKNFDPNKIGEGINDINITPFVDVVLVLLVIFMGIYPSFFSTFIHLSTCNLSIVTFH
jgi:biopolymer transport protein ExbD